MRTYLCIKPKSDLAADDKRALAENERMWLATRAYKLWCALALLEYIENGKSDKDLLEISKRFPTVEGPLDLKLLHAKTVQFGSQVGGQCTVLYQILKFSDTFWLNTDKYVIFIS